MSHFCVWCLPPFPWRISDFLLWDFLAFFCFLKSWGFFPFKSNVVKKEIWFTAKQFNYDTAWLWGSSRARRPWGQACVQLSCSAPRRSALPICLVLGWSTPLCSGLLHPVPVCSGLGWSAHSVPGSLVFQHSQGNTVFCLQWREKMSQFPSISLCLPNIVISQNFSLYHYTALLLWVCEYNS